MTKSRNDIVQNPNELSLLLDLPNEVVNAIPSVAPETEATKVMARLSNTSTTFYNFFQPELEKRAAKQLAQYIEDGDQIKAEAMVKANPRLLLVSADEVVNKNTNQIIMNYKPLQLAYCEGDDEMCLMLEPYFERACGSKEAGREEIRKQLSEKFGKGSGGQEDSEEIRKNRLAAVIEAITNEQFNNGHYAATRKWILSEATQIAILTFREEFAASQPKIIHSGMRFHLERLQEVYEAYNQVAAQWRNNRAETLKSALLEDAVVSFVLGYVPTNDAQRFSQGLLRLQSAKKKFERTLTIREGENFYVALRSPSADFILSGANIDIGYAQSTAAGARSGDFWLVNPSDAWLDAIQKLCLAKASNLKYLCSFVHERKNLGA